MIKNLIKIIFTIVLPLFFVIPTANAQSNDPFTIPSMRALHSSTGNFTGYYTAFATTTGVRFMSRSNGASQYNSFYFPIAPATYDQATSTVTFTVTNYQQPSTPTCVISLGWVLSTIPTYPWNPTFRSQSRTSLNVTATGTYSITSPYSYTLDTASGVAITHNASGSGTSYCDLTITDWTVTTASGTVDVYNLVTFPVTIGGGGSTAMGTTTIGTSTVTDSALFLLGIIASALIFLLLVKIIWKP